MKHTDTVAPVAAAVTALTTLVCCLPLGFVAAAAATTSSSVVVAEYQGVFLGLSMALLGVGFAQLWRAHRTCSTHRVRSTVVFCVSAAVVLLVTFFPQTIAALAADWLP